MFAARKIALDLRAGAAPLWVDADATRIAQVVGNLLHNASKFTRAHGHVVVSVAQDGPSRATVRVADDGIGIDRDMLGRLFEPFSQADDSLHRGLGGLGLGLALVKGLVEMHGGRVEARSEGRGRGTEITLTLPLLTEAEATPASPEAAPAPPRPLRLLVVEDNLDAAETLKTLLEMNGHEVAIAHDGHEGIAVARSYRPDVVLCDIGLPGLNGYEVARGIRTDPSASPALIALTGYTRSEDQRNSLEAGFDAHLGKPVVIAELEKVLAKVTARRAP